MASNCLFVRVPGTPFRFDDFRPDTELLRLACEALGEYDRVGVEDLGRLETFERFYPPESVPEEFQASN